MGILSISPIDQRQTARQIFYLQSRKGLLALSGGLPEKLCNLGRRSQGVFAGNQSCKRACRCFFGRGNNQCWKIAFYRQTCKIFLF
jgi:hypothetical protein